MNLFWSYVFVIFTLQKKCLQTWLKADHPLQKNMFEDQRQIIWSLIPNGFVNHGFWKTFCFEPLPNPAKSTDWQRWWWTTSWYTIGIWPLLAITCARYTLGIREIFLLVYCWYTGLSFLVYVLTSLHTAWYTGSLWFGIRAVYAGIRCSCLSGIRKVYAGIRWSPVTCRFDMKNR